jgi:hypothetical protein
MSSLSVFIALVRVDKSSLIPYVPGGDETFVIGDADLEDDGEVATCEIGVARVTFLISSFNV